ARRGDVGIVLRRRISVLNPEESTVGDHPVRVGVVGEERGYPGCPLIHLAVEQDAAFRRDRLAQEEVGLREVGREQQPAPIAADRHAARSLIAGAGSLRDGGVVELLSAARRNYRRTGGVTVVDLRSGDRK